MNSAQLEMLSKEIRQLSAEMANNAVFGIVSTSDMINEYLRSQLRRSSSTQAKTRILNILIVNGGSLNLTDISKKVFRDKSSVTRVIGNLQGDGLVEVQQARDDHRSKIVAITGKGLELVGKSMEQRRETTSKIVSGLSTEEMEIMVSLLKRVRQNVRKLI